MASQRIARLLASGLLLAGATALLVLGAMLATHGPGRLNADAWLLAWGLLFVVVLPAGAVVLTAVATIASRSPAWRTVPNTDRTIPRTGR